MSQRELHLFSTLGERVIARHYQDSKLVICGICGNQTSEEKYLENDCPHCFMGIDYEVGTEGVEEKLSNLERSF